MTRRFPFKNTIFFLLNETSISIIITFNQKVLKLIPTLVHIGVLQNITKLFTFNLTSRKTSIHTSKQPDQNEKGNFVSPCESKRVVSNWLCNTTVLKRCKMVYFISVRISPPWGMVVFRSNLPKIYDRGNFFKVKLMTWM